MRVNFRSFLIIGLNIMITIALSVIIGYGHFWVVLFLFLQGATLVGFLIFSIKRQLRLHIPITLGLCIALCMICFLNVSLNIANWSYKYDSKNSYNVTGTVDSLERTENGVLIVLKDLVIGGEMRTGNAIVEYDSSYYKPIYLDVGYKLILHEKIYSVDLLKTYGVNANHYRQNIRYIISTSEDTIISKYGEQDFFQKTRAYIHSLLSTNLDSDTTSILYGMITGDKAYMEYGTSSYYSAAGIGHIMAVSGLHVGFLCVILIFIFNLFTYNRKISRPIIIFILFLYAALVGFTPSVMRAVIMSSILLLIDIFGTNKDPVNNLFFAMTAILIVKPLLLFEVGFLLSCSTIFAISLFYEPIKKFFRKRFIPASVSSVFSISICAQLGIIPCMMFFFKTIQVYSLLINIFLMPMISLIFYLAVLGLMAGAIFAPLGVILNLSGLGLSAVDTIAQTVSKWQSAEILVFSSLFVLIIYGIFFVISDKVMTKKHKSKISILCAVICFFTMVFNIGIENKSDKNLIIPINSQGDVTTLLKLENKNILIGDINNFYDIKETLLLHKIRKVDEVYTFNLTNENIKDISLVCTSFSVDKLYASSSLINDAVDMSYLYLRNTKLLTYDHGEKIDNILAYSSVEGNFLMYNDYNLNILFASSKSKYQKLSPEIIDLVDFVRCYSFSGAFPKRFFIVNYVRSDINIIPDYMLNVKNYDSLAFNYESGKIASII